MIPSFNRHGSSLKPRLVNMAFSASVLPHDKNLIENLSIEALDVV